MNPCADDKLDMKAVATIVSHTLPSVIETSKVELVVALSCVGAESNSKSEWILTTYMLNKRRKRVLLM
jgi:hypothetical protein